MDAVIKVGGSLAEQPETLRALCTELSKIALRRSIVVVPGGGKFADAVRDFDKTFGLRPEATHRMAILAMDQYGLALSQLIPESEVSDVLADAREISGHRKIAVFLPSKFMFRSDPFEASWDVTSDSIAAHLANALHAAKLILATDVDGVYTKDPKTHQNAQLLKEITPKKLQKFAKRTSVDKFLPTFLRTNEMDCYVVNGQYPERLGQVLSGEPAVCTRISATSKDARLRR
jgi:5-(aminomethyl)-3-furanmethanol phosphate kinase